MLLIHAWSRKFDPNGNGYLSLAEIDKGIRDVLGLDQLYNCKPAIIRAYNAARTSQPITNFSKTPVLAQINLTLYFVCIRVMI